MIRLRTVLRTSPAVWVAPGMLLMMVLFTREEMTFRPGEYRLASTAAVATMLWILVPVIAGCAAWEGARLRRAAIFFAPHARSRVAIAFRALLPPLAAGYAVFLVTAVAFAGFVPDWRVVVSSLAVITAFCLAGFAIGLRVRPVVALPSVVLVAFVWMSLPVSLEPFWLRHLTGAWYSCCEVDQDVSPRALIAVLLVAAGLIVGAFVVLRKHPVLAIVPLVLGVLGGFTLVRGFGPDPVQARQGETTCVGTAPQICLWPEHAVNSARIAEVAAAATRSWQGIGVDAPRTFTEQQGALQSGHFLLSVDPAADEIRLALAVASLPDQPQCAQDVGGVASPYVAGWLYARASGSLDRLESMANPDVVTTVREVLASPPDRQREWYERNSTALSTCDTLPELAP